MKNERNAGRKPRFDDAQLVRIKERIASGEKVSVIAREYGISRQALYKRISEQEVLVLDYMMEGTIASRLEVDIKRERIHVENYAWQISHRAFGLNEHPSWEEFLDFLLQEYLRKHGTQPAMGEPWGICLDTRQDLFSLKEVLGERLSLVGEGEVPCVQFRFEKKDIIYLRTDTDGYQLKALSGDRRWFVKSQAIIAGKCMDDWAVEVIAAALCRDLKIPCVEQRPCEFIYGNRTFKGVYSANFELDGYSFLSFESLLSRMGLSSRDDEFVHLNALEKMKWCAEKLAIAGNLKREATVKYMLDLAVLDCLIGNVDRHTRNFGLFFNSFTNQYEVPPIFDNGMGLFEHDSYEYSSFDDAMRTVYVAPYGEDPFEFLRMLDQEYDLRSLYPGLKSLRYDSCLAKPFAMEFMERMVNLWRK